MADQNINKEIWQPTTAVGLHQASHKFWSLWVLCVCVWMWVLQWRGYGGGLNAGLWWSTLLNDYLFDCVLDCSNYLSPRQISSRGPDQSVSNGFWFISKDTAVTCAIITLEYCVLNGPEVQIKYCVSRKKLNSAFKNKDGEWWPCGRGPVSNKGIWSNLRCP